MKKTRSDKKYLVKVWCTAINKKAFKSLCMSKHLSMLDVGSQIIVRILDQLSDTKMQSIINENLIKVKDISLKDEQYELIGFKFTDIYWQKMAYYAVMFDTSIVKIATCIFNYSIASGELRNFI